MKKFSNVSLYRSLGIDPLGSLIVVIVLSLTLAGILSISLWDMNFWPTDARIYYFKAALEIPHLKYLSEMHQLVDQPGVRWLHGKEIYILSVSLMQRILHDFSTLRPFIVVGVLSICLASILIFIIVRILWGDVVGLMGYFFFISSFWSYLYILFAKHQTLGLLIFLIAVRLCLFASSPRYPFLIYLLSGASLCLSLYASTVSALYLPFYLATFLYVQYHRRGPQRPLKQFLGDMAKGGGGIFLGFMIPLIYINYPNLTYNLKSYYEYISISSEWNHFYYNQRYLIPWIPHEVTTSRGGWIWVIKYFSLIMPILFPCYCLSFLYLCWQWFQRSVEMKHRKGITLALILLSLSPPLLAEMKRVAQYGSSYFPSLIGVLLLLCYASHVFITTDIKKLSLRLTKNVLGGILLIIGCSQMSTNAYIFLTDIYPSR